MPRFQTRTVQVEAIQWTGDNYQEVCDFVKRSVDRALHPNQHKLLLMTHHGIYKVVPGDWIVKTSPGKYYAVQPETFREAYEPADEDPDQALWNLSRRWREEFGSL